MKEIPLEDRLPRTYRIAKIVQETEHVKTFTFPLSFGAKPGQFVMTWLPGFDEVPMSIAMDDGEELKITFFDVGDMTKELFKLNEGDLVGLRGPFGTHYTWQKDQRLILMAGGYGAAPMYFVANEAIKDNCTIDFVVGARGKEHLLYLEEIKGLKNTTLHIATDDGSMGYKGYNTEVLEKLLNLNPSPSPNPISVFACGPEMMMKRISDICVAKKVDCAMSLERYMKCGYGLCGNCVVDPLGIRLCIDGPVVKNEIVQNIAEFGKYHRDDLGKKHTF
ncbi:MAG TPA: dihydroorotate dehydrogenase electron transfer subunit [Candidatus Peribacterales bacterium]|nr:dihydroorotate dehydrogenase electron transfer subunit [Candidatus Peribacterales bacterium]